MQWQESLPTCATRLSADSRLAGGAVKACKRWRIVIALTVTDMNDTSVSL